MNEVMLALGDYRFSIATAAYQSLVRTQSWNWTEIARVGQEPVLQLTGKTSPTITLQGTIYPEFRGGFTQVTEMTAEAEKGTPLDLLGFDSNGELNTGVYIGQWVILAIGESHRVFRANGSPRAIEFTITLKRYAE